MKATEQDTCNTHTKKFLLCSKMYQNNLNAAENCNKNAASDTNSANSYNICIY